MDKLRILAYSFLALCLIAAGFVFWWNFVDQTNVTYSSQLSSQKAFVAPPQKPLNADKLFQLVNEWRVKEGYQTYKKSDTSCSIAEARLSEIKKHFSHEGFHIYAESLPSGSFLGENLIRRRYPESLALTEWLNSPTHRENLEASFTHSCIKCESGLCVHIFSYF